MGGLFGGSSPALPVTTPTTQASQDADKGASDLEKLQGKNSRRKEYGRASQSFTTTNNLLARGSDTTLSSGSLLSLGGTLA